MRIVLVIVACTALGALGALDLFGGNIKVGVASTLLAVANALLLTR